MRKFNYATIDTETVGGAATPTGMYNLGCIIHDRDGKVICKSNLIIMNQYDKIKDDDYSKKNFEWYAQSLMNGHLTAVATEEEAVSLIANLCKMYDVKYVMAWNSDFDFRRTPCRALVEDYGFEFIDIMFAFFDTVAQQKRYRKYCGENDYVTKKGSCRTTAEIAYRFLSKDDNFVEEHTALSDAEIEMELFLACLKTHKKFHRNIHKADKAYLTVKAI